MKHISSSRNGQILIQVIVFGSIAVYFVATFANWALLNMRSSRQTFNREQALQVAEAGIDYYRWHLAHVPTDFQDGTGGPGPYFHDFKDKDENIIGQFSLTITPPPLGSTRVTVKSAGTITADAGVSRSITAQFAKPSLAKYAVVANDVMRFGAGTTVNGPIHSNKGILFDGFASNKVTSAILSYVDPDHNPPLPPEFAVHTHVAPADPLPPAAIPPRTDVFAFGRELGVGEIGFDTITLDLAQMRTAAQTPSGFYRASSGDEGYNVVFVPADDTFNLYKVTGLVPTPSNCSSDQVGWGTWSIQTKVSLGTYPLPVNGIMFFEDHVFVEGRVDGARITLVAATLPDVDPAARKNIIVNNNLLYTKVDGSDVIGLIAQNNMNVGMVSQNTLVIDAALIAQNGRVGRHKYNSSCAPYHTRNTLTLLGMIVTNKRYGFAYVSLSAPGYITRNLNYDDNLRYDPPPSFPTTSDQYVPLSWQEK